MIKSTDIQELVYDIQTQISALRLIQEHISMLQRNRKQGRLTASKLFEDGAAVHEVEQLKYFIRENCRIEGIHEINLLVDEHRKLAEEIEAIEFDVRF